jgi:hypothetical protein
MLGQVIRGVTALRLARDLVRLRSARDQGRAVDLTADIERWRAVLAVR